MSADRESARVWLITGCSAGFGRALADAVDAIRAKHERSLAELDAWDAVSRNTAFD